MAILVKDNYDNSKVVTVEVLSSGRNLSRRIYDKRVSYVDTEYDFKVNNGINLPNLPYLHHFGFTQDGTYMFVPSRQEWPQNMTGKSVCPLSLNERKQRSLEYFYANASKENSFNLGIALAEGRETISMISNTAKRLAASYRNLRRGRIGAAFSALGITNKTVIPYPIKGLTPRRRRYSVADHKRKLKREVRHTSNLQDFAANTWLEMRYGWTPLLSDVVGAAEYVAKLLHENRVDLRLNGVYKYEGPLEAASPNFVGSGKEVLINRVDAGFQISNPILREFASLGLTNPALIAWELVPLSFVVDWFLPIGSWLEGFSSLQGLTLVTGSTTEYSKTSWSFGDNSPNVNIKPGRNSIADFGLIKRERMARIPSIPPPRFSLFSRMNGFRFTDAFALLHQAFK